MKKLNTLSMMGMAEMEEAVLFLFEKAQRLGIPFEEVVFNSKDEYSTLNESEADGMWNLAISGWLMPVVESGSAHHYFRPTRHLVSKVAMRTVED